MPLGRTEQIPAEAVLSQLDRILADPIFRRSERLSSFLRLVVRRALDGSVDGLKEYTIGTEVYHKGTTFDPRNDSTVRVEAGRLRAKLREYYEAGGRQDSVRIDLPKGGYAPTITRIELPKHARAVAPAARFLQIAAGVLVLTAAGGLLRLTWSKTAQEASVPTPMTTLPGVEVQASFSPDATRVAFVWSGPDDDNLDIYVKPVVGGIPVRLTNSSTRDMSPAWSPDGRRIAFFRGSGAGAFFIVPASGGLEQRISSANFERGGRSLDWFPGSEELVIVDKPSRSEPFSLYRLSVGTGERKKLTSPSPGDFGDGHPAVSPDGRRIAFTRSRGFPVSDLYVVDAGGGEPRRLTSDRRVITGLAWNADGLSIVISSEKSGTAGAGSLWRVPLTGGRPEQVAGIGPIASLPAIARRGHLLAFQNSLLDSNIWRVGPTTSNAQLILSTRQDEFPQYSPDGGRIAFSSTRSGNWEVWVAQSDGSQAIQLTSFGDTPARYPRWSPDGRSVAFDYRGDGDSEIYTVGSDGGMPRRIAPHPARDETPEWSRDGKWIYFSSNRSGAFEIWKIAVSGSSASVQLTKGGGTWPAACPRGEEVYFVGGTFQAPELWAAKADGSGTRMVLPMPAGTTMSWVPTPEGIYFLDGTGRDDRRIAYHNYATQRMETIQSLDRKVIGGGLAVSPDRKTFLYVRADGGGSDLMLVQNFR